MYLTPFLLPGLQWWGWINYDAILILGGKSYKLSCKKKRHCCPQTIYTYAYTEKELIFIRGRLILLAGLCLHTVEMKTDYLAQVWFIRSYVAQSQCLWAVWPQRRAVFHCEMKHSCATQTPSLYPDRPGRFAAECFAQLLLKWGWRRGMHNLTHDSFSSLREIYVKSSSLSVINCPVIRKCKQDHKVSGSGGLTVLMLC